MFPVPVAVTENNAVCPTLRVIVTGCWVKEGRVTGQVRLRSVPEGVLLLEGLSDRARARCLARKTVQRALRDVLDPEHADRATHWSMVARCGWVLQ